MEQEIWRPISFSNEWKNCDTSRLDEILLSWLEKRKVLSDDSPEYKEFINRLKRQHAIETGIIEKLYDLKEGITETFIKEGFVESYLQHGDTNIPTKLLMSFLSDNFDAVQFVFDLIKDDRPLTKNFLLQLHQLITLHQDYIDAIDPFGNYIKVPLLKGAFKKMDNNPKRADGTKFLYCPPVQVDSEIDNLLAIYNTLVSENVKPIIIASWLHHAFTMIHPFQDGNGRLAKLLATLVLVKNNLFPLTIKRVERELYISALESADRNDPQHLVTLFCEIQKKNIESILNWQPSIANNSLVEIASIFNKKLIDKKQKSFESRLNTITFNRNEIFSICNSILENLFNKLNESISGDVAIISYETVLPTNSQKNYFYTHQIIEYAKQHSYYFNKSQPRGWFQFTFDLQEGNKYKLIISIHHFGYDDSTMAIGSILEFTNELDNVIIPLTIKPYTISIAANSNLNEFKNNMESYLSDVISISLAQIVNES